MTVLRDELLAGKAVAVRGSVSETVRRALTELGASVREERPQVLVYDAAGAFADGGREGLRAVIDGAWDAILEVAVGWTTAPEDGSGARKIVLIAPRPGSGPFAAAATSALENLVRTLSVEWARFGVTATVIAPPEGDEPVAELVCFLSSSAGDYFSGCRFDLAGM